VSDYTDTLCCTTLSIVHALPFTAGRRTALTALLCTRVGWGAWEENNSPWTGVHYLTVWTFK